MYDHRKLVRRPRAFFDGGKNPNYSPKHTVGDGQEYILRLPEIKVFAMRIFLVCSRGRYVKAPQETFLNTGHTFETSRAPHKQLYRTVKVQVLTCRGHSLPME